jgi:hypothetical protein
MAQKATISQELWEILATTLMLLDPISMKSIRALTALTHRNSTRKCPIAKKQGLTAWLTHLKTRWMAFPTRVSTAKSTETTEMLP